MIINWRDGLAAFVGGSKYLIKGLFVYQHSATSVAPVDPSVPAPNIYARWDTRIFVQPDFISEATIRVNYDIEQDIKPRFKAKIDG